MKSNHTFSTLVHLRCTTCW